MAVINRILNNPRIFGVVNSRQMNTATVINPAISMIAEKAQKQLHTKSFGMDCIHLGSDDDISNYIKYFGIFSKNVRI